MRRNRDQSEIQPLEFMDSSNDRAFEELRKDNNRQIAESMGLPAWQIRTDNKMESPGRRKGLTFK